MCGILGIANATGLLAEDCQWIAPGLILLEHRGPDDSGQWLSSDSKVAIGHRRLSVIDLSSRAHQPMHSQDSQLHLTFNGEIYNFQELRDELISLGHKFSTSSDSEVLLTSYRQWGVECLKFLKGQFAFAIVDEANERLFLARDRAGEKPLYFVDLENMSFAFASEAKVLQAHPGSSKTVSTTALSSFLIYGFAPSESSIVSDISKLLPGTYLVRNLKSGTSQISTYWVPPKPRAHHKDAENVARELKTLLAKAIERQFIADVPVGILLSGGLDSSIVTALATEKIGKVKTYTATFPEDPTLDESTHARLITDHFSTDHSEFEIRRPSLDLIEYLGSNFDEPIFDSSLIPTYLLSCQIQKTCTVALGGDGADELFGGYRHYSRALQLLHLQKLIPSIGLKAFSVFVRHLFPFGKPGSSYFSQLIDTKALRDPMLNRMFDFNSAKKIFPGFDTNAIREQSTWREDDPIDSLTRQDFRQYLPNDILVKIDRYSMLTSLEMRSPFLDEDVVEYAHVRVPSHLKVNETGRKIILAQLGKDILPANFEFGRKLGFTPPVIRWGLTPEWVSFMKGHLLAPSQVIFDKVAISLLFKQIEKRPLIVDRLLSLTLFEIWRKKNNLTISD